MEPSTNVTQYLRAFTEPSDLKVYPPKDAENKDDQFPRYLLVWDTETTVDVTQTLRFGVYTVLCANYNEYARLVSGGLQPSQVTYREIQRGVFFNPGQMTTDEIALLEDVAQDNEWRCMDVDTFISDVFYEYGYWEYALIIGQNLPFDIGALAKEWTYAAGNMRGGFSFTFCACKPVDKNGNPCKQCYKHPALRVKHLARPKALYSFESQRSRSDKQRGRKNAQNYRGRFIDTATIAKAVAGMNDISLAGMAKKLQTEHLKIETDKHGATLTRDYITYAMNDIDVTYDVYRKLQALYDQHQLSTPIWKIMSEASLGKAYLKDMGIPPFRVLHSNIGNDIYGIVMSTFYGAQVEAAYVKKPIEVVYCDFKSQYPTVNALIDLQSLLIAEHIELSRDVEPIQQFLDAITIQDLQRRDTWRQLRTIVKVNPAGHSLPVRADFGPETKNIGICTVESGPETWYTLADVIASKLRTGRAPTILDAITFVPVGRITTQPKAFFGDASHTVDLNAGDDLFVKVIDVRSAIKKQMKQYREGTAEYERLDAQQLGIKLCANGTSYGIHAEFIAEDQGEDRKTVNVFTDTETFTCKPATLEKPGKYFSPIATFITAGGRLLLAIAERLGRDKGIVHAMCDTDSMVYARPDGMRRGEFWCKVNKILHWFQALYPYASKGELFELEDVNFWNKMRQALYFYGVSSKRYVIFNRVSETPAPDSREGTYRIRKFSAHGTGTWGNIRDYKSAADIPHPWPELYLPDVEPGEGSYRLCNGGGHRWQYDLWYRAIEAGERGSLIVAFPNGLDEPARMRMTITTPNRLKQHRGIPGIRPFAFFEVLPALGNWDYLFRGDLDFLRGKPGKPGNDGTPGKMVKSVTDAPVGISFYAGLGSDLIYRSDNHQLLDGVQPKTIMETMRPYFGHQEYKMTDPSGIGLLSRRYVRIVERGYIGKESDPVKEEDAADSENIFPEPDAQEYTRAQVAIEAIDTAALAKAANISIQTVQRVKAGKNIQASTLEKIRQAIPKVSLRQCRQCGTLLTGKQRAFCANKCRMTYRHKMKA